MLCLREVDEESEANGGGIMPTAPEFKEKEFLEEMFKKIGEAGLQFKKDVENLEKAFRKKVAEI